MSGANLTPTDVKSTVTGASLLKFAAKLFNINAMLMLAGVKIVETDTKSAGTDAKSDVMNKKLAVLDAKLIIEASPSVLRFGYSSPFAHTIFAFSDF